MALRPDHYLGMKPGDLEGKPYAPYWNPNMQTLPLHVRDAVLHGPEAPALGFALEDADQLLEPGYLALENGVTQLSNGQLFVAVRTDMPGCTGAMFEWWMGWHYQEHQRYKLWHPRSHVANGTQEMRGDDPTLSDREKYRTTHYVTEYIGDRLDKICITFFEPDQFFSDPSAAPDDITALVCGRVDLQAQPITIGYLIHQIRELPGGTEMRSRFWIGRPQWRDAAPDSLRNRIMGSKLVTRITTPKNLGRDLLVHCGMEMNHLASFLPQLYADYH